MPRPVAFSSIRTTWSACAEASRVSSYRQRWSVEGRSRMHTSAPVATLVRFGRTLRRAGLAVSLPQLECFARACGWLDPSSRSEIYGAAQATLLTRREDLPL